MAKRSRIKSILLAWVIAGSLDMLTALVVYAIVLKKVTAIKLMQGIASGILHDRAFTGGVGTAVLGVIIHYFNAFCFTAFYFLIYPKFKFLQMNWIISGLLYGLFAWAVMNLLVFSIVFPERGPITFESFAIGASILMVMIGLPVAAIAKNHYGKK